MTKTARDLAERLVWTVIAAVCTNLASVSLLGVAAWKGAAMAGLNGVVTFVLVIARQHLAVLPNPGEGLPGLPTDDGGQTTLTVLIRVLVAVALVLLIVALLRGHIAVTT